MAIIYTKHAEEMLLHRGVDKKQVKKCLQGPDKIVTLHWLAKKRVKE